MNQLYKDKQGIERTLNWMMLNNTHEYCEKFRALERECNKSLKILLGEYVREAGKDGRILDRFKKHVTAQVITDLNNVTQEYIDRELQWIADGEMVADDMLTIDQFKEQ